MSPNIEYDLTQLNLQPGNYSITVKAEATGYPDSAASTVQSYTVLPQLDAPTNVSVSGTDATFDEVVNATSYEFFADGTSIGTYVPQEIVHKVSLQGNSPYITGTISIDGTAIGPSSNIFDLDDVADGAILNIYIDDSSTGNIYDASVTIDGVIVASDSGTTVHIDYDYTINSDITIVQSDHSVTITTGTISAPILSNIRTQDFYNSNSDRCDVFANNRPISVDSNRAAVVTARTFLVYGINNTTRDVLHTIRIYNTNDQLIQLLTFTTPARSVGYIKGTDVTQYLQDGYKILCVV